MQIEDGGILKQEHRPSPESIFEEWYEEATKVPLHIWWSVWTIAMYFVIWRLVLPLLHVWWFFCLMAGGLWIGAILGYLIAQICVQKFHGRWLRMSFVDYFEHDMRPLLEERLRSLPSVKR